ncbi:DUF305 domain-containing protein [Mycolicibacterium sp.]|uniref:DUF305 domain-containing protein n=1 Tax=Mycolicibacterium sp. TaxID=2320850 RepID=UPI003D1336A4
MSRHSLSVGAAVVGATLALLFAGCTSQGGESTPAEHEHSTGQEHGADHEHGPTPQADGAESDAHNEADVTFARDMIPHHEQAIVMSDIILAKPDIDPRVTELATQIKAAQGPEITTMQGWLTDWGVPTPSGHDGHGGTSGHAEMGMMTDQQLEQLRQAQGADAARQFLDGMIVHHEGAVRMAQTEIDTGQAPQAIDLAHEIIETQQREIATMKEILGSL